MSDHPIKDEALLAATNRYREEDLELWKHHASFGGEDKNRMVTICTFLLGATGTLLWFILTQGTTGELEFSSPKQVLVAALLGVAASTLAAYMALLYGGYSNLNWEKADQIAKARGWTDLVPNNNQRIVGSGLNGFAKRRARPCQPEQTLAPVFVWFFVIAIAFFLGHAAIIAWSWSAL